MRLPFSKRNKPAVAPEQVSGENVAHEPKVALPQPPSFQRAPRLLKLVEENDTNESNSSHPPVSTEETSQESTPSTEEKPPSSISEKSSELPLTDPHVDSPEPIDEHSLIPLPPLESQEQLGASSLSPIQKDNEAETPLEGQSCAKTTSFLQTTRLSGGTTSGSC